MTDKQQEHVHGPGCADAFVIDLPSEPEQREDRVKQIMKGPHALIGLELVPMPGGKSEESIGMAFTFSVGGGPSSKAELLTILEGAAAALRSAGVTPTYE